MSLKKALKLVEEEYAKAKEMSHIKNPLAWALYQVWKKAETESIVERKDIDLTDKCGSCESAMPIKNSMKGKFGSYVVCQNPNKVWRHNASDHKQRCAKKCRLYQPQKIYSGGEDG